MSESEGISRSAHAGPEDPRLRILQFTIVMATLSWSLNVVSFLDVKEAAIWLGVLLLVLVYPRSGVALAPGFATLAPCWVTLGIVVAIGVATAPVPALVLGEGLRLLPLLLVVTLSFDLLQHPAHRVRVLRVIVIASACAAVLALVQRADLLPVLFPRFAHYNQPMYSVFGNQGLLAGALAVALTCLPAAPDTESRNLPDRLIPAVIMALLMGTLLIASSRGGLVAALAGMGGLWFFRILPARRVGGVITGVLLLTALLYFTLGIAPWEKWMAISSAGDTGGNFRSWVLRATMTLVAEHPVLGCGLGHFSRAIPLLLGAAAPEGGQGVNELLTEHAHFDLLEWVAETGLVGFLGFVWVISCVRPRCEVALCGLVAAGVFTLSHPAFYSAPHALVAILLYGMNVRSRGSSLSARTSRRMLAAVALVAIAGAGVFGATVLYPSYLLCRAEDRHLRGDDAWEDYIGATGAWGFHPDAHESFGIYCYERGDWDRAVESFQRARAGLDTGRIYQLLAMAASARGEHKAACEWYGDCLARWPWDERISAQRTIECSIGGNGAATR